MAKASSIQVYTLGYQGKSLPVYIETLLTAGISIVLDVREKAWSYKPGFSKTQLQTALNKAGIRYFHVRSAGNPSSNRKTATSVKECLSRYRKHLEKNPACVIELLGLIKEANSSGESVCLTCFERDHNQCHRKILLDRMIMANRHLKPVHLE